MRQHESKFKTRESEVVGLGHAMIRLQAAVALLATETWDPETPQSELEMTAYDVAEFAMTVAELRRRERRRG